MKRLKIRLNIIAFLLFVWLYMVYLFGILAPYEGSETIPWFFIGKYYLRAVNYNTHYQVINYQQPTISSLLPSSMPFIEKWVIMAEYVVLNNHLIALVSLALLAAFGIYLAMSGLSRVRSVKKAIT